MPQNCFDCSCRMILNNKTTYGHKAGFILIKRIRYTIKTADIKIYWALLNTFPVENKN